MQSTMENLFSYGTLQEDNVQRETFGRLLSGIKDRLSGYVLGTLTITNPDVIDISESEVHPAILPSGNDNDVVSGTVFQVSTQELENADLYETADYKRVRVTLHSGTEAWVYVNAQNDGKHG